MDHSSSSLLQHGNPQRTAQKSRSVTLHLDSSPPAEVDALTATVKSLSDTKQWLHKKLCAWPSESYTNSSLPVFRCQPVSIAVNDGSIKHFHGICPSGPLCLLAYPFPTGELCKGCLLLSGNQNRKSSPVTAVFSVSLQGSIFASLRACPTAALFLKSVKQATLLFLPKTRTQKCLRLNLGTS